MKYLTRRLAYGTAEFSAESAAPCQKKTFVCADAD
jgi:hypothetical protein